MDDADAKPVATPVVSASDTSKSTGAEPDDRTARRNALRDLAALIGVEVFY